MIPKEDLSRVFEIIFNIIKESSNLTQDDFILVS